MDSIGYFPNMNLQPTSQQPMSLMTISANLNGNKGRRMQPSEGDLLTIRILEASERKMQLIKKLLSPEQYDSIASNLFRIDSIEQNYDNNSSGIYRQPNAPSKRNAIHETTKTGSTTYSVPPLIQRISQDKPLVNAKSRSKSETNLASGRLPKGLSLQETLAKRRDAIGFFFDSDEDHLARSTNEAGHLAMELRSGYYLSSNSDREHEVINREAFSLYDRFIGLLGLVGISLASEQSSEQTEEVEQRFTVENKPFNGLPYTRERNLMAFESRLKRDQQYQRLAKQKSPKRGGGKSSWCSASSVKQSELVNLARLHSIHTSTQLSRLGSTTSSQADSNTVRVLQSVGHFNRIHLSGPKKLNRADSRLLVHPPTLATLFQSSSRKDILQAMQRDDPDNILGSGSLSLELKSFLLINHKLVSQEQQTERQLAVVYRQFTSLRQMMDKLDEEFICLCKQLQQPNAVSQSDKNLQLRVLIRLSKLRVKFHARVQVKQQELLAKWSELQAVRGQQGYASTGAKLMVDASSLRAQQKPIDFIDNLISFMLAKTSEDSSNRYQQQQLDPQVYLKQLRSQEAELDSIPGVLLRQSPAHITPMGDCPQEEQMRRRELSGLLESLRLRLLIGDDYFCNIYLTNGHQGKMQEEQQHQQQQSIEGGVALDISSALRRPICIRMMDNSDSVRVQVELYDSREKFRPSSLARGSFVLSARLRSGETSSQCKQTVDLNSLGEEAGEIGAQLELSSCFRMNQARNKSRLSLRSKEAIDYMYRECFHEKHPFEDTPSKLAKLLNRIDTSLLLAHFTGLNARSSYFMLLDSSSHLDGFGLHQRSATQGQVRAALLAWRWANNLSQEIHLSERENIRKMDFQLEKYKWKAKWSAESLPSPTSDGFTLKSMEHLRSGAYDYIRKCEHQIEEAISFNAAQRRPASAGGGARLEELLREPHLRVDFSGVARSMRLLVPRWTARRPLQPRRGVAKRPLGDSMLSLHGGQAAVNGGGQQSATAAVDLEESDGTSESLRWLRSVQQRQQQQPNLRLVVTIQQAMNVPLRLVRQAPTSSPLLGSSTTNIRSASPFYSARAASPTPVAANAEYLAQANTYVEVVFQRKQMASSLALGKNPAWNETLFFPVDLSSLSTTTTSSRLQAFQADNDVHHDEDRCGQLVDEYLQLNLYDCRCYQVDEPAGSSEPLGGLQPVAMPANRLVAVRQRIERHLLGSLRIPLTTLLTSGRIEGSFALAQPLLLDSYRFEAEPASLVAMQHPSSAQVHHHQHRLLSPSETYISLFVTLDPPVSYPLHIYLPTGSHEHGQVFEYARMWEQVMVGFRRHQLTARAKRRWPTAGAGNAASLAASGGTQQNNLASSRHVRALVMRDDARYCIVSRYLYPISPPRELLGHLRVQGDAPGDLMALQMGALARFVSLLSPLKYGVFRQRLVASNLWFDCHQLLDKALGGPEEKAILLCNYFLHLGQCSALLLGDAIPAGRCVFVITWTNDQARRRRLIDDQLQLQVSDLLQTISGAGSSDLPQQTEVPPVDERSFIAKLPILINSRTVQVWDPEEGRCYQVGEQQLPLVSVGSIVTVENVYANIQPNEAPNVEMNFDIRLRQFWFPLFEGRPLTALDLQQQTSQLAKQHQQLKQSPAGRFQQTTSWRRQLSHLESVRKQLGGNPLLQQVPRMRMNGFNYEMFTSRQCQQLRETIERTIKSHLLTWRPDRPTYFNRTVSRLIAEKLATFEAQFSGIAAEDDNQDAQTAVIDDIKSERQPSTGQCASWRAQLSELIREEVLAIAPGSGGGGGGLGAQVISWPVNMAYTSSRTILDGLYASGVHNADLVLDNTSDGGGAQAGQRRPLQTQFLVACHIHPYPARVLSIWLYVGAVVGHSRQNNLLIT